MNLLSIAHVPSVQVSPEHTVMEAVEASIPSKVGAVAGVDGGRLVGIFTERDVMLKVVPLRRPPGSTRIGDVMTAPVVCVTPDVAPREVLKLMLDRHIRHLPISDDGCQSVSGMLSIRNVLQYLVAALGEDLHAMETYIGASASSA